MSEKTTTETNELLIKLRKTQIIFALCCLIASGLMGVFFREFTRAFSEGLTGEELFFASYHLSIDHGHLLSIGFVIGLDWSRCVGGVSISIHSKNGKRRLGQPGSRFRTHCGARIRSFRGSGTRSFHVVETTQHAAGSRQARRWDGHAPKSSAQALGNNGVRFGPHGSACLRSADS